MKGALPHVQWYNFAKIKGKKNVILTMRIFSQDIKIFILKINNNNNNNNNEGKRSQKTKPTNTWASWTLTPSNKGNQRKNLKRISQEN